MAKAWGSTKAPSKGENIKVEDIVDLFKFNQDYTAIRLVGPVTSAAFHWIDILNKEGQKKSLPKVCLNWNPDTETFDSNGCPYCEHLPNTRVSTRYYANAIIRELQEAEPRKLAPPLGSEKKKINLGSKDDPFKVCTKEKGSKTWSPVRVVDLPTTVANKLISMSETNRRKVKSRDGGKIEKSFPLSDLKYGCDVEINLKKGGSAGFGEYDIQRGDKSSVSKEELELLYWNLNKIAGPAMAESLSEAQKNVKGLMDRLVSKASDDDDDDNFSSKRRKKKKGRDPFDEDDEDDDIDMDDEDDEDDDDEDDRRSRKKSSKKSKSKSSKKKKKRDPLEDLEDDLDEEDRRSKKKKKGKSSSRSSSKSKKRSRR